MYTHIHTHTHTQTQTHIPRTKSTPKKLLVNTSNQHLLGFRSLPVTLYRQLRLTKAKQKKLSLHHLKGLSQLVFKTKKEREKKKACIKSSLCFASHCVSYFTSMCARFPRAIRSWNGLPQKMVQAPSPDTCVTKVSNLHL